MYNDLMPISSFEIRICDSCGLRYPLMKGHPFGTRCPICMGETHIALSRQLSAEAGPTRLSALNTERRESLREHGGSHNQAVLLDNIRSAWNVGSILRSADGFGFSHVYLCGITPTADNEAVTKTSLGAEDAVPWSYHKDAVKLVKGLKAEGWKIYALEDAPRADEISHITRLTYKYPLEVLIVGNEVTGVDPELLDLCDDIFYIPMRGEKKSFNVAIAFGIAAYALSTQNDRATL
jgi:23S rRNA (guanosine2251-2'-O)-methyltransferase